MSFKSDLWTWLAANTEIAAAVGSRIYPVFAPTSAARPFIVYSRISSDSIHRMGTGSLPTNGMMRDVIQFDIYAESEFSANTIKEMLQEQLDGQTIDMGNTKVRRIFLSNETDGVETPSDGTNDGEYRETMDFTFWYLRDSEMVNALLLETGEYILLESGDKILLEAS
jgi:hypothetical protein